MIGEFLLNKYIVQIYLFNQIKNVKNNVSKTKVIMKCIILVLDLMTNWDTFMLCSVARDVLDERRLLMCNVSNSIFHIAR